MNEDRSLIEESQLRASLRLEAHEAPPRLDPAVIAAAARSIGPDRSDVLPVAAVAFVGGWVMSELSRGVVAGGFGALLGPDRLGSAIDALTVAAIWLAPALAFAASAAFPLMIAVAALIVIAFEQRRTQRA